MPDILRHLESEFLFQRRPGFGAHDILEFGAEDFADGAVELHRLGNAHAVQLDAHNEQTRP